MLARQTQTDQSVRNQFHPVHLSNRDRWWLSTVAGLLLSSLLVTTTALAQDEEPEVIEVPEVSELYFNSEPADLERYRPGEIVTVTVEFTPAIATSRTCPAPGGATYQCPTLTLQIGEHPREAALVHIDTPGLFPSSTPSLTHSSLDFEYEIVAADFDLFGISIPADGLDAKDVQLVAVADGTTAANLDLTDYAFENDDLHPVGANQIPYFDPPTITYQWTVGQVIAETSLPEPVGGDLPISRPVLANRPAWLQSNNYFQRRVILGTAPTTPESGTMRMLARDVDGDNAYLAINYHVVETIEEPMSLDINANGQADSIDALILYYAFTHAWTLSDGLVATDHAVPRRRNLLQWLAAPDRTTDADLQSLLFAANTLLTVTDQPFLDVNEDDAITTSDILAIYYVLAFPELVGSGLLIPGFRGFRQQLLGEHAATSNPSDEELKRMIQRIRALG